MSASISLSALLQDAATKAAPVACGQQGLRSFAAFYQGVAAVVTALRAQPGKTRLYLLFADSYSFAIHLIAALHEGREVVLLPNSQPATLTLFSPHFDAVLTDSEPLDSPKPIICVDSARAPSATALSSPLGRLNPHSQLSLYTSGSTGHPKRVVKTLEQLEAEVQVLEELWGEQLQHSVVVSTVPHHHIYGLLFRVLWPLAAGRVFSSTTLQYEEELEALADGAFTLISSPAFLKRLDGGACPRNNIVAVFSSGGPLSPEAAMQCRTRFAHAPFEVLGSTETGGIAWRRQSAGSAESLWSALPRVELELTDQQTLQVTSPFIGKDQHGLRTLVTEDRARFNQQGLFCLLGRADRIVKLEEKRVSLAELEAACRQTPWISEAKALLLERGQRTEMGLVAVLSTQGDEQLKLSGKRWLNNRLRDELNKQFERVVLPRRFRFVKQMPENAQGKSTQAQLLALFDGSGDKARDGGRP